ncbi:MAG: 1,4-alpha-glucan branching protein GlgB [Selenomonadaceae bacterium]|nr:1,4-alpha-glucan branching protein GlgB [Selenomonadaceae bacterium]
MKTAELKDFGLYLFHQGTNCRAYEMLGAHFTKYKGRVGVRFALWAPHAAKVSVVGDFNAWDEERHPMFRRHNDEVWVLFVEGLEAGALYKYAVTTQDGAVLYKADPYGFCMERRPGTASRLYDLGSYKWQDGIHQAKKRRHPSYGRPMLIYEVHLGSWRRGADGNFLTYRDMAAELVPYAREMRYTHLEFLPLMEHPLDDSWGYQVTGFYAVTSRFGTPDDFRYLVDVAHQNGLGVIMDWVPGHFCRDDCGLREFDGETLYESASPERAENRGWGTLNFDYGRAEVQSFLISNAMFWLEEFHVDGLRIDGVANMLYLDYGRGEGEWTPNKYGDKGNLEAMALLRKLNETVFRHHPQALMIAEESTAWPQISRPVQVGGMGFNYKWNMGWMNDMLSYLALDPVYRKWNHDKLTFSFMYAFSENFVLPLSHDEMVHGKGSLISKLPGDYAQKFAGLRGFLGYFMAHPGKKLTFMGSEFAQFAEWNFRQSLDWHLVEEYPMHAKMLDFTRALNEFYQENKALWQVDFDWNGFQWIECDDNENSVVTFLRKAEDESDFLLVVTNFTPKAREGYRVGVPMRGIYREVFSTDAEEFGGGGMVNTGVLPAADTVWHGRMQSILIKVPPLATLYFRLQATVDAGKVKIKSFKQVDALRRDSLNNAERAVAVASL